MVWASSRSPDPRAVSAARASLRFYRIPYRVRHHNAFNHVFAPFPGLSAYVRDQPATLTQPSEEVATPLSSANSTIWPAI